MTNEVSIYYRYIYALVDPRDNLVRYIGQSKEPAKRLSHHVRGHEGPQTEKDIWISDLLDSGFFPTMVIVEAIKLSIGDDDIPIVDERELSWMVGLKALGQPLLNKEVFSTYGIRATRIEDGVEVQTSERLDD